MFTTKARHQIEDAIGLANNNVASPELPDGINNLISITTPGDKPLIFTDKFMRLNRIKRLMSIQVCDDTITELFTQYTCEGIFDFIFDIRKGENFICHCDAGMSRSMAIVEYAAKLCGETPLCHEGECRGHANQNILRKLKRHFSAE